jgi:hypothetical protein
MGTTVYRVIPCPGLDDMGTRLGILQGLGAFGRWRFGQRHLAAAAEGELSAELRIVMDSACRIYHVCV